MSFAWICMNINRILLQKLEWIYGYSWAKVTVGFRLGAKN